MTELSAMSSAYLYRPVPPDASSDEDEKQSHMTRTWFPSKARLISAFALLGIILAASIAGNAILLYQRHSRPWELSNDLPTQHVGLRRDVPRDIVPPPEFSSLNRTVQDAAWNDPKLSTWDLFVALDESYVVSQGLSHAQRWPWDLSKGVYIPYAAHELHCIQVLRLFVNDKEDGVAQADLRWDYEHAIHCLNLLRESVMCNADEQLMYTGRLHANVYFEEAVPGRGVMKMCRNWDSLKEWAHAHSACYSSVHRGDPSFREVDRYKYCPDGSRPWEQENA